MEISYTITGADKAIGDMAAKGPAISAAAIDAVTRLTYELEAYVKSQKLSGSPLHVRSGNLRNSVNSQFSTAAGQYTGSVGTGIAYGAIHEFGGVIQMHMKPGIVRLRTDVKGNLMRQMKAGIETNLAIFAKASHKRVREVAHEGADYTITMPERSFLRSSLRENRERILAGIRAATMGVLK